MIFDAYLLLGNTYRVAEIFHHRPMIPFLPAMWSQRAKEGRVKLRFIAPGTNSIAECAYFG